MYLDSESRRVFVTKDLDTQINMILKTFQDQKSEILLVETRVLILSDVSKNYFSMLILTVSIQWKKADDSFHITSRNKLWRLRFFQMKKGGWRLREGSFGFFFASTDPRQFLWIWDLHSLYCSENLTLARNMYWSQCEFFCCLGALQFIFLN